MMDQSKALHRIREAADLIAMVEELLDPTKVDALSAASWAGIRATLRNAKDTICDGHAVLTKDFIARARQAAQSKPANNQNGATERPTSQNVTTLTNPQPAAAAPRQSLASSVERFVG